MRKEIALALAEDRADRANARREARAEAAMIDRLRHEEAREEANEMEAIYRAQDAAHEARYGRYDDDGYDY